MTTRRRFLKQAAAASVIGAVSAPYARAGAPKIKKLIRRDETIVRSGGFGWVGGMTWSADDRLLVGIGEGMGWPGMPEDLHFQSALIDVARDPQDATFQAVAGYPLLSMHNWYRPGGDPSYYGSGLLAVGNYVYQYLPTFHGSAYWGRRKYDPLVWPDLKCTKLIYSKDHGRTWCNQDGTQPVYFEQPKDQSNKSMIFWDEPKSLFSSGIKLLQMGKGYSGNRDGYVYGYTMVDGGDAAELAMFRVPKTQVRAKESYEYFAGRQADGSAHWARDISAWAAVHRFPNYWSCCSIVHNAPLGLYMMTAQYAKDIVADAVTDEPIHLGLWVASQPCGPWEQVYEESPWVPAGGGASVGGPHISPKWIASDGKSFWMTWDDWSATSDPLSPDQYIQRWSESWYAASEKEARDIERNIFATHANFRFIRQRVDLVVA